MLRVLRDLLGQQTRAVANRTRCEGVVLKFQSYHWCSNNLHKIMGYNRLKLKTKDRQNTVCPHFRSC